MTVTVTKGAFTLMFPLFLSNCVLCIVSSRRSNTNNNSEYWEQLQRLNWVCEEIILSASSISIPDPHLVLLLTVNAAFFPL